ncbi:MAG: hypothetical protein R2932_08995 [Caldilineaceae bacterium]
MPTPTTLTISRNDEFMQIDVPSQQLVSDLLATIEYRPVLDTLILGAAEKQSSPFAGPTGR